MQSLASLMAEEDPETLMACWTALGAVTATIPKEVAPSHVRCVKEAIATAKDRRRRRKGDRTLPGLCLPKALTPILPIYLQGLLQVRLLAVRPWSCPRAACCDGLNLTMPTLCCAFIVQSGACSN